MIWLIIVPAVVLIVGIISLAAVAAQRIAKDDTNG